VDIEPESYLPARSLPSNFSRLIQAAYEFLSAIKGAVLDAMTSIPHDTYPSGLLQ
jgi:hypothetical protein